MLIDKKYFNKHQEILLTIANSFLGEFIFKFKKMGHYLEYPIVKITPNSVCELVKVSKKRIYLREHFFSRPEYALKIAKWYSFIFPVHIFSYPRVYKFQFGCSTITAYPVAGANSPCDGIAAQSSGDNTWSVYRNASGNYASVTDTTAYAYYMSMGAASPNWSNLYRSIYLFDTSAIGSVSTVTSATFSLYFSSRSDGCSIQPDLALVSANPASTSTLTGTDYSTLGTTNLATRLSFDSQTINQYNDMALNSSGRTNISKTGISKFGVRNGNYDSDNAAPTWNSSYLSSYLIVNMADLGSNKPKLVVSYYLTASVARFFAFFHY